MSHAGSPDLHGRIDAALLLADSGDREDQRRACDAVLEALGRARRDGDDRAEERAARALHAIERRRLA